MQSTTNRHVDGIGLAYGLCAILIWGSFPLYFKQTESFGFLSVYGHRALWAMPFMLLVLLVLRSWHEVVAVFRSRRLLLPIAATSLIVATQQALYIWGIFTDRIVELSMGFYLVPAFSILFGYLFFQERIGPTQWLAVGLSISGVAALIIVLGENPWLGITMGLTFTVIAQSGSEFPLSLQQAFLGDSSTFLYWLMVRDSVSLEEGKSLASWSGSLLPFSAIYTIFPILLYVVASRRMPLSLLGTMFYLAPTGTFLIGVFVYDENFSQIHVVAFLLIWVGLSIYLWADWSKKRPA